MSSSFRFTVKFPDLHAVFTRWGLGAKESALNNLLEVVSGTADEIGAKSQEFVPTDTGDLAASGHLIGPFRDGNSSVAAYGYSAPYAAAEHEGFHGGKRVKGAAPRFLANATAAQDKNEFQMQVYSALIEALRK